MENIIIETSCRDLRREGAGMLAGKWRSAIVVQMIFAVLTTSMTGTEIGSVFISINGLWLIMILGALNLGLACYYLNISAGGAPGIGCLFSGFKTNYLKSLGLFWYILLFSALWGLLFIIPGIIAVIRYSQSFYILGEHPEYSISECVNESKRMMKGNKAKYFKLYLSYIGWGILATCISVVFAAILLSAYDYMPGLDAGDVYIDPSLGLVLVIAAIDLIITAPVLAYIQAGMTAFYRRLTCGFQNQETVVSYPQDSLIQQDGWAEQHGWVEQDNQTPQDDSIPQDELITQDNQSDSTI